MRLTVRDAIDVEWTVVRVDVETKRVEYLGTFTQMDVFPTTLAAMGFSIEGNRLGLGANLFSDEPTLMERYGVDRVRSEIRKYTDFVEPRKPLKY